MPRSDKLTESNTSGDEANPLDPAAVLTDTASAPTVTVGTPDAERNGERAHHFASGPSGSDDPSVLKRQIAERISQLRQRPLFVWSEPHESIRYACVSRLRELLQPLKPAPRIDLLIASPGGYIDAAYHCMRLLRRVGGHITILVPESAKSAATFLALGADDILFGLQGELGPLDAQLHDPRGFSKPLSALNEFKSLEYIREYSMETLDMIVVLMLQSADMDVPYALEQARSIIGSFTTPLYSQVRPQELGEYRRLLAIGEEYAKRAMRRWGYSALAPDDIDSIVNRLVWDYPTHEFVIDYEEACDIGLHAHEMEPKVDELCMAIVRDHMSYFDAVGFEAVDDVSAANATSADDDEEE